MAAGLSFPWYNLAKLYMLHDNKSDILLDTFFFFFSVELMDWPGVVQQVVKCRVLRLFFLITLLLSPSPKKCLGEISKSDAQIRY